MLDADDIELVTPTSDAPLPSPYMLDMHDIMRRDDAYSETAEAARADTPNPYDRLPPIRPLRELGRGDLAVSGPLDIVRISLGSSLYVPRASQISVSSLGDAARPSRSSSSSSWTVGRDSPRDARS